MRVQLVYPGHSTSTIDVAIGLAQGLKASGVEVHEVLTHDLFAFYQGALAYWEENNRSFEWNDSDVGYMAACIAVADMLQRPADIALVVTGITLHKTYYECMKRLGVPIAVALTESPYSNDWQKAFVDAVKPDVVFVNDKASTELLGGTYLPHSYNPSVHHQMTVGDEYKSDVCFVGTLYPERRELLSGVNWEGIKFVGLGGEMEMHNGQVTMATKGRISNEEAVRYYNGAKIVLNLQRTVKGAYEKDLEHIGVDEAYSIGPRAYEVAACGAFQIAQDGRPEYAQVFGDSVPMFRTSAELEGLARRFLSADEERLRLTAKQSLAVQGCSFEARARQIVIPLLEGVWRRKYMAKTA
jgi:spore maturation protein CgeB